MYRWTLLLCALTTLVYLTLDHFNKLPPAGAFEISRWWDVVGLVLFAPLTVQVFRAMCSTDYDTGHLIVSFFLGWLAEVMYFFWKGCLAGFIAMLVGFIIVLGIYYFLLALKHIGDYVLERFGWWLAGEAHQEHSDNR